MLTILSLLLAATLAWQGVRYAQRERRGNAGAVQETPTPAPPLPAQDAWQRDVAVALDEAVRHATEGDVTDTEISVDRATSFLTFARLHSKPVPLDFYDTVLAKLDQILLAYHENTRLIEHVTLARIELAQLRSSLESVPSGAHAAGANASGANASAANSPGAASHGANSSSANSSSAPSSSANSAGASPSGANSAGAKSDEPAAGHILAGAPRALVIGSKLDPASLGGNYLDATSMPPTAEILEPPSSRLFVDDVRVENLAIAGGTQTLDGMHWKNVIFIGTRLRYEGGEVDLQNVRFVHCMFGFTTDGRGARIASAIAAGKTTLVIE